MPLKDISISIKKERNHKLDIRRYSIIVSYVKLITKENGIYACLNLCYWNNTNVIVPIKENKYIIVAPKLSDTIHNVC